MGHLTRIINDLIKAKANGPNEDAITSLYNGEYFNNCLKFFSFLKFFRNVLCLIFALRTMSSILQVRSQSNCWRQ